MPEILRNESIELSDDELEAVSDGQGGNRGNITFSNLALLKSLGSAYLKAGQYEAAVTMLRRAANQSSGDPEIQCNLGIALARCGLVEEAVQILRHSIAMDPDYLKARSTLLFILQHAAGIDPEVLFQEHWAFGNYISHQLGVPVPVPPARRPGHRLRLGYVSLDLGHHPVGHFLAPVLEACNHEAFEIFCYSDRSVEKEDDLSDRLRKSADVWRRTGTLSDGELAQRIRDDGIDILVDLAGHTKGNRLAVFAMRAAPVQVTWIGYVGGTGLTTMDFAILDHMIAPTNGNIKLAETILRLPGCFLCYQAPDFAPAVSAAPSRRRGYVTFGSFNRPMKIGKEVIRSWAQILAGVPNSRLVLKSRGYAEIALRERITAAFVAEGIDSSRIELRAGSPHADMLGEYGDIDIALDPFPFTGGITTCETLWMGVPVITLAGATPVSRMSLSFLTEIDLGECATFTQPNYVLTAVRLAEDEERRQKLRDELRERIMSSHLGNTRAFTAAFEKTLLYAWQNRQ
jgi:predicted O-linked N-acetylglucosamine transferase (SPINDLY family)